jgi:MraZ protein
MFRGSYQAKVDEKGRLKIPIDFKREIDERYGSNHFYITSRHNGKDAEIFPLKEWEAIEQAAANKPATNPKLTKFFEHTSFWGQMVDMDPQGRLLLPAPLREKARLQDEVSVAGTQKTLTVRNGPQWSQEIEETPLTDEDLSSLGF